MLEDSESVELSMCHKKKRECIVMNKLAMILPVLILLAAIAAMLLGD